MVAHSTPTRSLEQRPIVLVLVPLAAALAAVGVLSLMGGSTGWWSLGEVLTGLGHTFGLIENGEALMQVKFELRLHRLLTALGVGASLALSGGLLQGVFRNDLASPGIIGITSGASLGAVCAIVAVGGGGGGLMLQRLPLGAATLVSLSALGGGLLLAAAVTLAARRAGRISVATLLLVGIAANATVAGFLVLIQYGLLEQFEMAKSTLLWGYGNLDDRSTYHVRLVWGGLLAALAFVPFVARELDLLAGGEEDAASLGVNVMRVTWLALLAATIAASTSVAGAGPIGFVGLVAPHVCRAFVGRAHRRLLPACLLVGPLFLVGLELAQRSAFPGARLPTGVLMALVGGPLFFVLLMRQRHELDEL